MRSCTCTYPLRAGVAHKASSDLLQLTRSAAALLTASQPLHPASSRSTSTVRLRVVFSRPLLLLPSGRRVSAMLLSLKWSCLRMYPMNFHLWRLISTLIGLVFEYAFSSRLNSNSFVFMSFGAYFKILFDFCHRSRLHVIDEVLVY